MSSTVQSQSTTSWPVSDLLLTKLAMVREPVGLEYLQLRLYHQVARYVGASLPPISRS